MIASADGYQPRAATLTVDEQPVEIALLLPRSAVVAGAVRAGGAAGPGRRVVVRQEGEVVDEIVTDGDGGYRFDDLAEGVYAVAASARPGAPWRRVTSPRAPTRRSTWTSPRRTAHADRVEHVEGRLAGVGGVELYWQGWLPGGAPRGVLLICHGMGEHSGRYATVVDDAASPTVGPSTGSTTAATAAPAAPACTCGATPTSSPTSTRSGAPSRRVIPACAVPARPQHGRPDRARLRARPPGRPRRPGALGSRAGGPAGVPRDAGGGTPCSPGWRRRLRRAVVDLSTISRDEAVVADYRADPLVHQGHPRSRSPWRCSTRSTLLAGARPRRCGCRCCCSTAPRTGSATPHGSRALETAVGTDDLTVRWYDGLWHEIYNEPERAQPLGDLREWLDARVERGVRCPDISGTVRSLGGIGHGAMACGPMCPCRP